MVRGKGIGLDVILAARASRQQCAGPDFIFGERRRGPLEALKDAVKSGGDG